MQSIGIDIGGTFTDLVSVDIKTGQIVRDKVPTTPRAPHEGFLRVLERHAAQGDVERLLHATTIVTNLIVERKGARVGLLTTVGFRDVLEIQRSYRPQLYDLQWKKTTPFVPRRLRRELTERVGPSGEILGEVDTEEVTRELEFFVGERVEAIAVCLFNSYANPHNERVVRDIAEKVAPGIPVSLSSDVDPRVREYERTSTVVLNAYAQPPISQYVSNLHERTAALSPVSYMQSAGGVVPWWHAQRFPVQLLYSGPAGGVIAAAHLSQTLSLEQSCSMDMGGTSCDVCLIQDGQPSVRDTIEVEWGIPARANSIDIHAIGAGGGSVVSVDSGGALRVGPESVGAEPGPACYGRGGVLATVTDANLIMGLLSERGLLGGTLRLDAARARAALEPIADELQVTIEELAIGVFRIVNANMAQAIRKITIGAGLDPREFSLIAFGGAGGQHAASVALEADIGRVVYPRHASAFSALGLVTARISNTAARSVMLPAEARMLRRIERAYVELESEVASFLSDDHDEADLVSDRWADVRYVGQSHELRVEVANGYTAEAIVSAFESAHRQFAGVGGDGRVEIVNVGVTMSRRRQDFALPRFVPTEPSYQPVETRLTAFSHEPSPVFLRERLPSGWSAIGPCLIEETDSIVYVPSGAVHVDPWGNLILELRGTHAR